MNSTGDSRGLGGASSRPLGRVRALCWMAMALVGFVTQSLVLLRGPRFLVGAVVNDDLFYYLEPAWRLFRDGFVTFDGLHATNGFQLMWFASILPLAAIAPTKLALLYSALALSFLFNAISLLVIWRIGEELDRPGFALLLGSLWSFVIWTSHEYSRGMDNSLHGPVFWLCVWMMLRFLLRLSEEREERKGREPPLLPLALALVLNAWVRPDAGVYSAVLFVGALSFWAARDGIRGVFLAHGRLLALATTVIVAGAALQLSAWRLAGDTFFPISAIVKSSWLERGVCVEQCFPDFVIAWATGLPTPQLRQLMPLGSVAFSIAFAVLLLCLAFALRRRTALAPLLRTSVVLLLAMFLYHVAIISLSVPYPSYFEWYRTPHNVTWVFGMGIAVQCALESIANARHRRAGERLVGLASIGLVLASLFLLARFARIEAPDVIRARRYDAAMELNKSLPPSLRLGSMNAGTLGYFSENPVVNLDGLINDYDYYNRVLSGSTSLQSYLEEWDVRYVIEYEEDPRLADFRIRRRFEPDSLGRSMKLLEAPKRP